MKTSRVVFLLAIPLMLAAAPAQAETGDLKLRFEYGGEVLAPPAVNVNKDIEFCGKHGLKSEKLLINTDNKGLKNVIVYVYTGRGKSDLPKRDESQTHTLANENCRFNPHIVLAQSGDKLEVTNPDPVGHNANLSFIINRPENFTVPTGGSKAVELVEAEPAPIPVECNIHPWMKAHVVVLDHPFAAKSDENGELVIKGLPAGDELTFRVWVEAASGAIGEVSMDGKTVDLGRRNTFEVEIEPGLNDVGTVIIPAEALPAE